MRSQIVAVVLMACLGMASGCSSGSGPTAVVPSPSPTAGTPVALTERGLPSLAEVLKKPADYIDKYVVWRVTPGKIVSKRGFLAKVDDKPVFIFLDETMPDAATFARGTRLRVEGYVREASRLSLQPSATAGDFAAVKGAQFYLHVLGPTPPEAKKSSKSRPSLDSPGGAILARYGPLLPGGEAFQRR